MNTAFWKTFWKEARSQPAGVYLLAALTLLGLVTGILRLAVGLGNTTNLNDGYPWGLWIGFDLFVVAFSGGAFTLATLVYIFHLERLHVAIRPTVLTGLLGYLSVLIILAMDLGRWDRFYHFMIYPNINSPLFEVSWCIFLYTLVLVVEFSPVYLQKAGKHNLLKIVKQITIPLVIVGITLSTLHQSSLGTLFIIMTNRLHPLWHSSLIPLFFFVSSLAAGLAMVVGGATVSYWVFHRTLTEKVLDDLGWFIPWVTGFYLVIKFGELIAAGEEHLLFEGGISLFFWAEMLLMLAALILFSIQRMRTNRVTALFGAILVLGAVFINRFSAAWWAQSPVKAGYSYFPSWIEITIQVGVLSGMALVYTLVGRYFPLFEGTQPVKPETIVVSARASASPGD